MSLDFYQIYFKDEQIKECYDFATPYRNETLTDYFENSIIADLAPKSSADFISVCSWRLKEKRMSGLCPIILKFGSNGDDLSEEKILSHDFDIANLRPFSPNHRMLENAAYWHGGTQHKYAWEDAISELRKIVNVPNEVRTPIYENAFIARKEIYQSYVNDCLVPVMHFMSSRPVFYTDSGYAEKKMRDRNGGPEAVESYRNKTGRNDWPIAPFVLERLFSIWINDKDFKIINL